jgi:putative ABC transport system substrate-binding protein
MNVKDERMRAASTRRARCENRRSALRLLAGGLCALAVPLAAFAQAPAKVWRIGVLNPRPKLPAGERDVYTNFFDGMRDLGYVEGRNFSVYWLFADNDLQRLPALAAELVKQRVDVIVTNSTPAVRAAQQATTSIPIIGLAFGDPVAMGFAASLARPGGNITGLSIVGPQMASKRLEILTAAVPNVNRIAYLVNPDNVSLVRAAPEVEAGARKAGKEMVTIRARSASELGAAFDLMPRERVGALLVADDTMLQNHWRVIGSLALKAKLPAMVPWPSAADGALLAYRGTYPEGAGRRGATLADKILKGAKPGDLPIEQPTKFNLVVNLKTAKALGIAIPQSLLVQATQVIE